MSESPAAEPPEHSTIRKVEIEHAAPPSLARRNILRQLGRHQTLCGGKPADFVEPKGSRAPPPLIRPATYERIGSKRGLHDGGEAIGLFAEVHRACCHQNPEVCSSRNHDSPPYRTQHRDERLGLGLADDTHDRVIDRDLDRAGTNRGRLRRIRQRRSRQTPRSPPAQTPARRHRSRVMAMACLCNDAAAVPDSQQTHQQVPRSRLHAASPRLSTPREQLLRAQPMAPRHLRHADAGSPGSPPRCGPCPRSTIVGVGQCP